MRCLAMAMTLCGLLGTAFGQGHDGGPFWSLGGYGNVLYPGTGHAPPTPVGPGIYGNRGVYGNTGLGVRNAFATPLAASHGQHRRTTIVPYPVFYGSYGYAYPGPGYAYDPSLGYAPGYADQAPPVINGNGAPSVVFNQNFVQPPANPLVRDYPPSDVNQDQSGRLYQVPTPGGVAQSQAAPSDEPTLYLIAFKDHTIVQALGYWMEGSTLHYVSVEHTLNQASMDLIDRDLSQRLNAERNIDFRLSPVR